MPTRVWLRARGNRMHVSMHRYRREDHACAGALLDLAVVITDDPAVHSAAQDPAFVAAHPSWTLVSLYLNASEDTPMGVPDAKSNPEAKRSGLSTSEQWLASVLLLRHARHLFGSPRTHLFMMAAELSLGLRAVGAAAVREGRGFWEGELARLWSVDVPFAAGAFGFLGANLRPTTRARELPATASMTWSAGQKDLAPRRHLEREARQQSGARFPPATSRRTMEDTGAAQDGAGAAAVRTCDGDRVSVARDGDCRIDIMREREYLPSLAVIAAARARAERGDPLTADLEARLRALQETPTACSRARLARFPNHGAAASMNYLVIQLKRGLRDQRPVVFTGHWIYAGCVSQDLSCLFVPSSVCNTTGATAGAWSADGGERDWSIQSHGIHEVLGGTERGGSYPERQQEVDPAFVLPVYEAEGRGVFWYNSVVTGYALRLQPVVAAHVQRVASRLGLARQRYIGVQIRRGDACGQTRPCLDVRLYAEHVVRVARAYSLSWVYVSSDDPDASSELQAALDREWGGGGGEGNLTVVGQQLDRAFLAKNTEQCAVLANQGMRTSYGIDGARLGCEWIEDKLARASFAEKEHQSLGVVTDIEMLANASAFVGTFTSALNRVAFQLSFSRKGYVMPFVSLDIPWCWAGFHLIQVCTQGKRDTQGGDGDGSGGARQ